MYREFAAWVRDSRRFGAFADSYRGKILAKVVHVHDEASMKAPAAELATAALLLRDERFTLEYEKCAATKGRGPDFTVTWRTHTLSS